MHTNTLVAVLVLLPSCQSGLHLRPALIAHSETMNGLLLAESYGLPPGV